MNYLSSAFCSRGGAGPFVPWLNGSNVAPAGANEEILWFSINTQLRL
jgi:hypothetical protein